MENSSVWVRGLRIASWVAFVAIVIAGIVIGAQESFLMGLLGAIVSAVVAFLTVAMLMIFLDMASDIATIKETLLKTNSPDSPFVTHLTEVAKKTQEEKMMQKGGWKCKECGKTNPQYTGTCSCGNTKYENGKA